MMYLAFHIGKCCGIKTIYGMGVSPAGHGGILKSEDALSPLSAKVQHDRIGAAVSSGTRFFHEKAPQESKLDRLDRYLKFVKRERPQHIVEIVLAESVHHNIDQSAWVPELETRGFKLVNSCKNSNSGSTVHVYHLNVGE